MTTKTITIRQQRTTITSTTHTPYELEHVRWTARYRLSEQLQRNGDFDLRRTLLNANLLDSLDEWQTRHPYVRPAPVVLPQPTFTNDDSTPPPVMVRDFAAMSSAKKATPITPIVHTVTVDEDDDDSTELFPSVEDEDEIEDEDDEDIVHDTERLRLNSATSLTSGSSDSDSDDDEDDDDDIWDSEYHDTDNPTSPFHLSLSIVSELDHDASAAAAIKHEPYLQDDSPVLEIAEVDEDDDDEDEEFAKSPSRLPSPPPTNPRSQRKGMSSPTMFMPRLRPRPGWRNLGVVVARG